MDTNNLAKQIISKIWYYVENPENEQHSGKKLIDLIETSFNGNDISDILNIIKNKEKDKIATLINLVENKLIENNSFQKQANYLAFLNDRAIGFDAAEIENPNNSIKFSEILISILFAISILGRLFVEGSFHKFNLLITSAFLLLILFLKKHKGLRILLALLLIIYTAPLVFQAMVKEMDWLALIYLINLLGLIIIMFVNSDFKKQ